MQSITVAIWSPRKKKNPDKAIKANPYEISTVALVSFHRQTFFSFFSLFSFHKTKIILIVSTSCNSYTLKNTIH